MRVTPFKCRPDAACLTRERRRVMLEDDAIGT
jgi:hypothetical protein